MVEKAILADQGDAAIPQSHNNTGASTNDAKSIGNSDRDSIKRDEKDVHLEEQTSPTANSKDDEDGEWEEVGEHNDPSEQKSNTKNGEAREVSQEISPMRTALDQSSSSLSEENVSTGATQHVEGHLCKEFLQATAGQLTDFGLKRLRIGLREGELCVFFRNNHFSTLFRHNEQLFVLVTDEGFADIQEVVWETLESTTGDTHYFDQQFKPSVFGSGSGSARPNTSQNNVPWRSQEEFIPVALPVKMSVPAEKFYGYTSSQYLPSNSQPGMQPAVQAIPQESDEEMARRLQRELNGLAENHSFLDHDQQKSEQEIAEIFFAEQQANGKGIDQETFVGLSDIKPEIIAGLEETDEQMARRLQEEEQQATGRNNLVDSDHWLAERLQQQEINSEQERKDAFYAQRLVEDEQRSFSQQHILWRQQEDSLRANSSQTSQPSEQMPREEVRQTTQQGKKKKKKKKDKCVLM